MKQQVGIRRVRIAWISRNAFDGMHAILIRQAVQHGISKMAPKFRQSHGMIDGFSAALADQHAAMLGNIAENLVYRLNGNALKAVDINSPNRRHCLLPPSCFPIIEAKYITWTYHASLAERFCENAAGT